MARTPFEVLSESHVQIIKQLAEAISLNDKLTEENQKLAKRLLDLNNGTLNSRITNGPPTLIPFSNNSAVQNNQEPEVISGEGSSSEEQTEMSSVR